MSQLIGTTLLGGTFVQDKNPLFLKIDAVTIGESSQFGYTTINSSDIGSILQKCYNDAKAVVIIYNWQGNVAYIKTGFALHNAADSKVNPGYTSYIVTSRITANNLPGVVPTPGPTPQPTPTPGPIRVNEFVRVTSGNFTLNGKKFVPVGFNAFCLGLMQETMTYPTHAQITEIFEAARTLKATVIRSHTLGFSAQSQNALLDGNNNINAAAWDSIDWSYAEAKRCGIKLIPVLCDVYEYYNGSYKTFCTPYGIDKNQFFTNSQARTAFKKYIATYLNHVNTYTGVAIKDNIVVACLELGNELGEYRPDSNSTAVPTQEWISDISSYIKSLTKILVLNGSDECLGGSISNDFAISSLDAYSQHFYWNNSKDINNKSAAAAATGKPYIIGEYSSRFGSDWFSQIESISNVKGSCAWAMYPHDNGNRIQHNDGFTFWFDSQDNDNTNILLNLTNHYRRMQNLPTVNNLF